MNFKANLKSQQKGVAILFAIFIISMIVWMASELLYETTVEYAVHAKSVHRLQAYYLAKSGLDLSRLRIQIYNKPVINLVIN